MANALFKWMAVALLLFSDQLIENAVGSAAEVRTLDAKMHHLRWGATREWDEFPVRPEGEELKITFHASPNREENTIFLRHRGLKIYWKVLLNDHVIGRLPREENHMVSSIAVKADSLLAGENTLRIIADGRGSSDDVWIGEVRLDARPMSKALAEARVEVVVVDADGGAGIPCRLTVVKDNGPLMTLGAKSDGHLAVRPGVIYTGDGRAKFGLPTGNYTLYAGRGFEYSLASVRLSVSPGDVVKHKLTIEREVPTPGYISCDTHVHTLTYSGHGDSTIAERMVTIPGEGLELVIATDHNKHIDYEPHARESGMRKYFTPVIGNEVSTRVGHFNIFPVVAGSPPPDHRADDWQTVFSGIHKTPGVQIVVLNHPRDLHGGYRPFGPKHHISITGQNTDGWKLQANAMEVINSGATQTDGLLLFRDWFGLLNRGHAMTPVASSDSHDVARKFLAQGRTYIRCRDDDPGRIDVREACNSLRKGRVMVSLGLLAEILVEDRYGPGDLVPVAGEVEVAVRVLGPSWTSADHVALYANGAKIREVEIDSQGKRKEAGVLWSGKWKLARPKHDLFLSVIATGPGIAAPYWPISRPFQPTSTKWTPYVLGATGAVWLDVDRDGRSNSAYEYAGHLVKEFGNDIPRLFRELASYDEAVAAQVASRLLTQGANVHGKPILTALAKSAKSTRHGFEAFLAEQKAHQIAGGSR